MTVLLQPQRQIPTVSLSMVRRELATGKIFYCLMCSLRTILSIGQIFCLIWGSTQSGNHCDPNFICIYVYIPYRLICLSGCLAVWLSVRLKAQSP